MATRHFRFEYLRDLIFELEDVVHKEKGAPDPSSDFTPVAVVFRAKDDGKHYRFRYGHNARYGIYSTEGWDPDRLVECPEVEKVTVSVEKWVVVPGGAASPYV